MSTRSKYDVDKFGNVWYLQRIKALERDRGRCMECGRRLKQGQRQVHHIEPYVVSRSHELNNLLTICDKCHKETHEGRIEGSYSYRYKYKYRKRKMRKLDSKKHHHSRAVAYNRRKKHKREYGECD